MSKKLKGNDVADADWQEQKLSDFADTWTPEKVGDTLIGIILEVKTANVKRGKKLEEVKFLVVESDEITYSVWESAKLSRLFEVEGLEGKQIKIEYKGEVQIKGQKNKMKDYRVWLA